MCSDRYQTTRSTPRIMASRRSICFPTVSPSRFEVLGSLLDETGGNEAVATRHALHMTKHANRTHPKEGRNGASKYPSRRYCVG